MEQKNIFIIAGIVALALVLMFSSQFLSGTSLGGSIPALSDKDHIEGNKDASVVVIEYGDYQCPACGTYHATVKQAVAELGNQIAFSFRHFPLPQHMNAPIAAYAAEAAGLQGKYWEMNNMLYENQTLWAEQSNARDHFIAFAKDLKLDVQKFQNDLDSQEVKQKVAEDLQAGIKGGVDQTPTFFVNGKKISTPPNSVAGFKAAIGVTGSTATTTTAR